jgi:hypothetical protein
MQAIGPYTERHQYLCSLSFHFLSVLTACSLVYGDPDTKADVCRTGPAPDKFLDALDLGEANSINRGEYEDYHYYLDGNSFPKAPKYGKWIFDVSFAFESYGEDNYSMYASLYQYPYGEQFPPKDDPRQEVAFAYEATYTNEAVRYFYNDGTSFCIDEADNPDDDMRISSARVLLLGTKQEASTTKGKRRQ